MLALSILLAFIVGILLARKEFNITINHTHKHENTTEIRNTTEVPQAPTYKPSEKELEEADTFRQDMDNVMENINKAMGVVSDEPDQKQGKAK